MIDEISSSSATFDRVNMVFVAHKSRTVNSANTSAIHCIAQEVACIDVQVVHVTHKYNSHCLENNSYYTIKKTKISYTSFLSRFGMFGLTYKLNT